MRKTIVIFLFAMIFFVLCSCSYQENNKDNIRKNAELESDSDYKQAETLKNDLDSEGYYTYKSEPDSHELSIKEGEVLITFAKNAFLNIEYYTGSDMNDTNKISNNYVYLKPGESLYAKINGVTNPNSSEYEFSKFIVREKSSEGAFEEKFAESKLENNIVLSIQENYKGNELMVIPVGQFNMRTLNFSACWIDKDNKKREINGLDWRINDELVNGNQIEVSPVKSYKVSCDYSRFSNDYYFKTSISKAFYHNKKEHIVEFLDKTSTEESTDFEVVLHKFITIKLSSNKNLFEKAWDAAKGLFNDSVEYIKKIELNDKEQKSSYWKDNEIKGIREEDVLRITVSNGYILESKDIRISDGIPVDDGTLYSLSVPETNLTSITITIKEKEG